MARRFRRFRRKTAPLKLSWVTTVFTTGLDITGTALSGQVLLDEADWEGDTQPGLNRRCVIRRIIANFGWTATPDFTEGSIVGQGNIACAVGIEDQDENEVTIAITAVGSLLQQNRVLWTHLVAMGGTGNDSDNPSDIWWGPTMQMDWSGRISIQPHERIVAWHQWINNMTDILGGSQVGCLARVLIEHP